MKTSALIIVACIGIAFPVIGIVPSISASLVEDRASETAEESLTLLFSDDFSIDPTRTASGKSIAPLATPLPKLPGTRPGRHGL